MAGGAADTARSRAPLHPYLSALAADTVATSAAPRWFEVDATVACFDISGFSSLAERLARRGRAGAEHVNDVLNDVFGGLIAEVHEHGGDVLEFGGDAMVVLFRGPGREARAAIATARMLQRVAAIRPLVPSGAVRVAMSCGIASGPQAFHLVGERRRALMIVGEVSSRMAQLQSAAVGGQAFLDDETAALLPAAWVRRTARSGTWRLRARVAAPAAAETVAVARQETPGSEILLPVELRALTDVGRRGGELKLVGVGFILLDGTDGPAAAVHTRLRAVTAVVEEAAAAHGTCWLETQLGDGAARWTLVAGAPVATERDPEHLVRALHAITAGAPEPLRIGANLGDMFVGDMGHPARCTFIAMGDATNVAARLMSTARPGQILVGERLARAGAAGFTTTPVEPLQVKGRRAPVAARLVGPPARPADEAGRADERDGPPLVGRAEELAALRAALATGGVVELIGEAGSGKSRVWREVRTDAPRWLVAHAEPDEIAAPYAAIGRLLRERAGGDGGPGALVGLVVRVAPAELPWLPLVAGAIGVPMEPTPEVARLASEFRVERLRTAMAGVVAGLLGAGGVLVVDDAHWLDEPSRAVLATAGRTLRPGAAMLVVRRPGEPVAAADAVVELTPLAPDAAERLVLAELPARLASDAILARLRDAAAGNPLFLLELARRVACGDGVGAAEDGLPESVQRLLAARIDALPPGGRRLIRDLAVLGARIDLELAARVLDRPDLATHGGWAADLGDLVAVDERNLSFRHDLVRAAAYEGSSDRRRRDVHRCACDHLARWGDDAPVADTVAALAFHAVGSGDPVLVARWCQHAADSALDRGAMEVAEQLLRDVATAEHTMGAPPDRRRATLQRLAVAAERAGDLDVAATALRDASHLADVALRPAIAVDRARVLEKLGRYRGALVVTARALRDAPPGDVRARLLLARATIRSFLGDWAGGLRLAAEVLAAAPDDDRLRAQAHLLSEWCCSCLGLAERTTHEEAALAGFTRVGDDIGLGNLHLNRGVSAWSDSRVEDALADFRASAGHYRRAGDVVGAAMADNNIAEILTLQGRLDEAEELLQHARRVSVAADYRHGELTTISGLSRVAAWSGDVEQAAQLQATALAGFHALASDDYVVDSLLRTAEIAVLRDSPVEALAALDEAAAALAKLGDVPVVPATLARLRGRALHDAGRHDEALVALDDASRLAIDDRFTYEQALVTVLRGRLRGDPAEADAGRELLATLGVVSIPPVC